MNFELSIASFASMDSLGDTNFHIVLMTIDDWMLVSGSCYPDPDSMQSWIKYHNATAAL